MKYQSSNTKQIYELDFIKKYDVCPECSKGRKKSNQKSFQYYKETNTAYCHHCNATFFEYKPFEKKEYKVPEWKNKTDLTDKAVKYFEGRGISQSTLRKMKIYSDVEWMPQHQKNIEVICFPYFVNEKLVNVKYRGAMKSFKMVSNAQLVWYNFDCITENNEIIICEGEIDALTLIQCGFTNTISVPNGAKNNDFIDETIEIFEGKKILLSTDSDTPGIQLRDELIRRFGVENCKTISYKECKDANEYYQKYGGFELQEAVKKSKDIPVEGNFSVDSFRDDLEDLFRNGLQKGATIGFDEVDKYCTWETKRLAIVTGSPGSGKSEFVDYVITRLNLLSGWKAAYFTPENFPIKYHYAKIYEKLIGKQFSKSKSTDFDFDCAYEYIQNNFFYILPSEDFTIDKILLNAKMFVKSKGIKILVIDPYNKIDHQIPSGKTETQYISTLLDKIITFAKMNDLLVFLIAHPTKMPKGEIPSLYNISGSANFYNKTDYGLTVHRTLNDQNLMTNDVEVHWQKIKFKNLGEQGVSELRYNYTNGRFEERTSIERFDNSNWIVKDVATDFMPIENDFYSKTTEEAPF